MNHPQREPVRAWVTKYALTSGIQVVQGEIPHNISSTMLCYGAQAAAHRNDWHRTREAAIARANEMKAAKIASLKKQIAKLEALTFEDTPQ